MRVVAGSLRGRALQGPGAGNTRIRPTSDRAREALFSILQKWPSGGFLDLFGGTGALAVEAWSRSYEPVFCVEQNPDALGLIERNVQGTRIQVLRKDIRKLSMEGLPPFAVVFADPPYEESVSLWQELAPRLTSWLTAEGVLVWESDQRTELPECPAWTLIDTRKYGTVRFHIFEPAGR
jgi:16S rRNA (guanine966-N2)-methyltransferase